MSPARSGFFEKNGGAGDVEFRGLFLRAIENVAGNAAGFAAQRGAVQANFIVREMQFGSELIEAQAFGFDVVEGDIGIENRRVAGTAAAKRTAEHRFDGIAGTEDGLDVFAGSALSLSFERPGILRGKAPIAVKLHGEVEGDAGLTTFYGGVGEFETIERIVEVTINFIEVVGVVLRAAGIEMTVKRGPGDGAENAAAKGDVAANARGNGIGTANAIDEIVPVGEVFHF